jgi:hypothetical protein
MNNLFKPVTLMLFLLLWTALQSIAQIQPSTSKMVMTTKAGNWSDPLTWSSLRVPDVFDSVSLQHNTIVDIDAICRYLEVNGMQVSINPGKILKVEGAEPVIKTSAYVVDTSLLRLISNPTEISAGVFKYKQSGLAPTIKVGSVLVGAVNGGYLRRVTALDIHGDTIIAQTVQGTMEEVFEKAQFSLYFDGDEMEENPGANMDNDPVLQNETANFTYNINGATLIEYGLSRLDLTSAKFQLKPSFQFDYDFGLTGLNLFEMKMKDALLKGEVDFDVKLGAGKKEYQDTLKRFTKIFAATIGAIPVTLEAELMFISKVDVELAALSFTRSFKYKFDYSFDANARYENDGWTTGFQVKSFEDTLTFEDKTEINTQIDVGITITPSLTFRVYSVVGPNIKFPTSLNLKGRYFYEAGSWDFGISAKSDLNWGADIKISKYTIEDFGPYNLWSKQWFDYKAPFKLVKISGNGQTVTDTSSYLKDSIKVQVLDSKDKSWRNVPVFFQLRQSGTLSAQKVFTDDSGYARIQWKPGTDSLQILDVWVKNGSGENVANSPDSFFARYGSDTLKVIKVFDMSNTPAFTTNFFKTIGLGKGGYIYAGTVNNGFYKCIDTNWTRLSVLTNNNINDIQTDNNGGIWIAQYGASGAQATNGGINYFPDSTSDGFTYYGAILGAPTRNARGIFIDQTRTNGGNRPRLWTAHMAHITAGVSTTGAIGLGLNEASPFFNKITNGVDISLQNGSIQSIGGNSEEVWAFASNNFGRSQILRYDAANGTFLGAYDYENITVPGITSNFSARAIYFDSYNNKWIGLLSGGLVVKEGDNWLNVNMAEILPAGTSIGTNGISGGSFGKVFIATSNGLLIYSGGDKTNPASYKLITMEDGLPSNNVLDVIERREDETLIVATGSGIAFIKGY